MKIWKYKIEVGPITTHEIPRGSIVRHVGIDPKGDVCAWVEVNPTLPKQEVRFICLCTGQDIPIGCDYCGRFQVGEFVGHVYQIL